MNNFAKLKIIAFLIFLTPVPVFAYVGPGAGLSAIGSLLALLLAIVVAIYGFIWFPVKRFLRRNKQSDEDNQTVKVSQTKDETNTNSNVD